MAARKATNGPDHAMADSKPKDANGFVYLSPWLPTREGWYRIAQASHRLWRWRLYQSHEQNAASGERWVRWRLFEDYARVDVDVGAAGQWSTPAVELPQVRDRAEATDVVDARWSAYREGKVPV